VSLMNYVYYRTKIDHDPRKVPQDCDIFYSREPITLYSVLEIATSECHFLNGMSVHHGKHYCQFEVERVGKNKFAILCKSHPEA